MDFWDLTQGLSSKISISISWKRSSSRISNSRWRTVSSSSSICSKNPSTFMVRDDSRSQPEVLPYLCSDDEASCDDERATETPQCARLQLPTPPLHLPRVPPGGWWGDIQHRHTLRSQSSLTSLNKICPIIKHVMLCNVSCLVLDQITEVSNI